MKRTRIRELLACTIAFSASVCAEPQCEGTLARVSGSLVTFNLSDTVQTGFVTIKFESEDTGRVIFDRSGLVIGVVEETIDIQTPAGQVVTVPFKLDHHMYFGALQLHTSNDMVDLASRTAVAFEDGEDDSNPTACAFTVTEYITEATGTRRLRAFSNDDHLIEATGIVSFCQNNNLNRFEMSGYACAN